MSCSHRILSSILQHKTGTLISRMNLIMAPIRRSRADGMSAWRAVQVHKNLCRRPSMERHVPARDVREIYPNGGGQTSTKRLYCPVSTKGAQKKGLV